MLGGCIFSAQYDSMADIYRKNRTVLNSGQIKYNWVFYKTIQCTTQSFKTSSFRTASITETISDKYFSIEFIQLRSKEQIPKDVQITNIRNNDETIYKEIELKDSPPTWFNSHGSNIQIDPFGRIYEYITLLSRAEVQGGL